MSLIVSELINQAAVYLNDPNKVIWTNTVLLPYVKAAWHDFQLELENNQVPCTRNASVAINVTAGQTTVASPSDIISPYELWERTQGSSEKFAEMYEKLFPFVDVETKDTFGYWAWYRNELKVPAASVNREVKVRYLANLGNVTDENSSLNVINGFSFLSYKTAALAASFTGRAPETAKELEARAINALRLTVAIDVKSLQSQPVRRMPWR